MRIAILGTRGIPNNYGGFEQFAEYISVGLFQKGHEVFVYSPHNHQFKKPTWNGVNLIHCFDPEFKIGTAGQFIYDLNCIIDSRKRNFDVILQLGYTSSSIWSFLFPKKSILITNMDGLEWKRTKYGKYTQKFLKFAESLAVRHSTYLISDSIGIRDYVLDTYKVNSEYIPYGANIFESPNFLDLEKYPIKPYEYDMLIARLEPENSIEIILDGFTQSTTERKFVVVGNKKTKYGELLLKKYENDKRILFFGSLYDMKLVNNLRYYSNLYFHGHTVGGTNPSLLEAMASNALIAANNNQFNETILGSDAFYFNTANEVKIIIENVIKNEAQLEKVSANLNKINNTFSWNRIISSYEDFLVKSRSKA